MGESETGFLGASPAQCEAAGTVRPEARQEKSADAEEDEKGLSQDGGYAAEEEAQEELRGFDELERSLKDSTLEGKDEARQLEQYRGKDNT